MKTKKQVFPNYEEYQNDYVTKREKVNWYRNGSVVMVNYLGSLFLMTRSGRLLTWAAIKKFGGPITLTKYWFFMREAFNRPPTPLTKSLLTFAKKNALKLEKDPFYGLTSKQKNSLFAELKKKQEKRVELDSRKNSMRKNYGPEYSMDLVLIELGSLYLYEEEEFLEKLEVFYTKEVAGKRSNKSLSQKIKTFLDKLKKEVEDGAEAEHMASF